MKRSVRPLVLAAVAAVAAGVSRPAHGQTDTITVGVFAPAAPFQGTPARIDFATRLAERMAASVGAKGIGRVYGRSRDFAAAVRKGELQLAVVDATYLASIGGGYTTLAVGVRGGQTAVNWQLISRTGATRVLDLRGRSVLVPSIGGREADFVLHAMLGGELPNGFFSRIDAAPDAVSAVAAVGLGKADAAVVPSGIDLPSGVKPVAELPSVSLPVLVAYAGLAERLRGRAAAAATSFKGDAVIAGFRADNGDAVRKLSRRFSAPRRRGPMAIPNIRIAANELIEGRRLAIGHADVRRFAVAPKPVGN